MKNYITLLTIVLILCFGIVPSANASADHSEHSAITLISQFPALIVLNSKACKLKLCGCAAEAKKAQSAEEKEYLSNVAEGTMIIIDDIPKQLEPIFGEIMDHIVLVSQATPKTEGFIRPPVNAAIYALNEFSMAIGELQAMEKGSKEYKDKLKTIKNKFK